MESNNAREVRCQLMAVRQRDVDVELIEGVAPSCVDLLNEALSEKEMPKNISASYYAESVETLRNKGFTWSEVQLWFQSKGISFSTPAIIAGWRRLYGPKFYRVKNAD